MAAVFNQYNSTYSCQYVVTGSPSLAKDSLSYHWSYYDGDEEINFATSLHIYGLHKSVKQTTGMPQTMATNGTGSAVVE